MRHSTSDHRRRPISACAVVTGAGYKALRVNHLSSVEDLCVQGSTLTCGFDVIHNAEDGITVVTDKVRREFIRAVERANEHHLHEIEEYARRACAIVHGVENHERTVNAAIASRLANHLALKSVDAAEFEWLGKGAWGRVLGGVDPIPVTVLVSALGQVGVDIDGVVDGLNHLDCAERRRNRPRLRHISERTLLVLLGDRLAQLRRAKDMSQDGLSNLIGKAQGSIAQWESGQTEPSIANVVAYAQALEINPSAIFFGLPHGAARNVRLNECTARTMMLNDLVCFDHLHTDAEYATGDGQQDSATGGFAEDELHALMREIGPSARGLAHRTLSFDAAAFLDEAWESERTGRNSFEHEA